MKQQELREQHLHLLFLFIGVMVYVWSFFDHYDLFAWFALSIQVVLGVGFFVYTYRKFTFSTFVYAFGLFWAILLLIGAKHTYSNNPTFDLISEYLNLSRNYYDRVAHFFQGFIPAMIIKEYLYRKKVLKPSTFSLFLIVCLVLSFSAFYELIEFAAAEYTNRPASYILDTQGHNWDTQWDMIMAILGGISSLVLLGKHHDKHIAKMAKKDTQKQ